MTCPPVETLSLESSHLNECEPCRTLVLLRSRERPNTDACDAVLALLPLFETGLLESADTVAVEAHLSQCPACLASLVGETVESTTATVGAWTSASALSSQPRRSTWRVAALGLAAAAAAFLAWWWTASRPVEQRSDLPVAAVAIDAAPLEDATPTPPPDCPLEEWCVVYELPDGHDGWLGSIWGVAEAGKAATDVFVAGRNTIVHYNGVRWAQQVNHSDSGIFAIGGSTRDDVYAVGSRRTIQRWDGKRWRLEHRDARAGLRRGSIQELHVEGQGIAYAADTKLWRRDGGKWREVPGADGRTQLAKIRADWRRANGWPSPPSDCSSPGQLLQASPEYWVASCYDGEGRIDGVARGGDWVRLRKSDSLGGAVGTAEQLHLIVDEQLWQRRDGEWKREPVTGKAKAMWGDSLHIYVVTKERVLRKRTR